MIPVRKPLAMPVVPAVVPPLSPFRDGGSRPATGGAEGRLRRPRGAGATGKDSLSRTSRYCACHVARVPRRRGKVPCGETEREVGETPGMPAGAGMVGGRLTRPHAYLPPDRAQARRGRRGGQVGGHGRDHAARAAPGAGGPCGRGPDDVGEGLPRGHRRPRRVGHRGGTSGGSPTGAAQGSGNAPDGGRRQRPPARRGNAAVVTGPYGASLKPPATPGDLYRVLTWNSVPGSRTLNLDGMRTVVAREPIRVDSQMPRAPS